MRRIAIRKLIESDAEAIREAVAESREQISKWMDWCHKNYDIEDARSWAKLAETSHKEGSQFQFGIIEHNGRYLGGVGLSHINDQAKCANLGYWVRTSAAGSGVAPEAVRQAATWAFSNTDLHRLEIVIAVENARSIRVAEKVGAVKEGVLRSKVRVFDQYFDGVMYSIVRGDY